MNMKNKVVFAAAGNGKTYNICAEAIKKAKESNKYILILSYTNEGVNSIRNEYEKQNKGVIDSNIIIKTWYSFLLSDWIKPYQCLLNLKYKDYNRDLDIVIPENYIKSIAFYQEDKPKYFSSEHIQYYINSAKDIRKDDTSQLAFICNLHSCDKVINRLTSIYSEIFIDELQDYAGWDLELFDILFKSTIPITCVGDYKQSTYRTNNSTKNKKFRDSKIIDYFLLKEKKCECVINYSNKTRRFNQSICNYINKIFNDDNSILPYCLGLSENKENIGVYLIDRSDIDAYCNYYQPTILRYNSKTEISNKNCQVFTYGASKGMTLDRTVIFPIKTILPFILKMKDITSNQTRAKFYVACTRAKYSLVFVTNGEIPDSHFVKTELLLGTNKINCYKFQ